MAAAHGGGGGGSGGGGYQHHPAGGLLLPAPDVPGLPQQDPGKLAHTHHPTVFYCGFGVVGERIEYENSPWFGVCLVMFPIVVSPQLEASL